VWSATPGTTEPLAPFGVATLAAGGSEGNAAHMAAMRWAQQANYGQWDNPALPNSFGAQLYDLGDPWYFLSRKKNAKPFLQLSFEV
jgi:hypothetical protein